MGQAQERPGVPAGAVFVHQFVDEGLGNAAHLVGSKEAGVAALIDPLRDVDRYVAVAERAGVRVAYAIETHLHDDFVSGAREVAAKTGATVAASADAGLAFDHRALREGDRLALGDLVIEAVATPGHTPEHMSYLLRPNGAGAPAAVFTGGALIVGGAARTDLLGKENAVPFARQLYRTVHGKMLSLPDDVAVFPTHGAGSYCAAPSVPMRRTTIGRERATNPLATARTEEEFVARAFEGLPAYPPYFGKVRPVNQRGPAVLGGVPIPKALRPAEVREWASGGGAVLDVRPGPAFQHSHVPAAYGIGVYAPLVVWAGWLIPFGTPLVLVAVSAADLEEAVRQLIRIGYDDVRGHLAGGMGAWEGAGLPVERVRTITPAALRQRLKGRDPPVVIDVREDDEWADGHLPDAVHVPNGTLPTADLGVTPDREIVVHCNTFNRSTSGLSVLARRGFRNVALLDGGYQAWAMMRYEVARD